MNKLTVIWVAFLALWKAMPNGKGFPPISEIILSLILFSGLALILIKPTKPIPYLPLLLIAPFFMLAWIARKQLGETWERPQYRVTKGVYSILSHPIYMSVFIAALITAVFTQTKYALLGITLIGGSLGYAGIKDEIDLKRIEANAPDHIAAN